MLFNQKNIKLSKRYLWSFFAAVSMMGVIITLLLSVLFGSSQTQTTAKYSVAQLDQVGTSTDILFDSLQAITNQVLADRDTYSFMLSQSVDRLQEAKVGTKLTAIKTANPYIRYITLYNAKTGRFVGNSYAGEEDVLEVEQFYEHLEEGSSYGCFYRSVGVDYSVQQKMKVNVFTFVFPLNLENGQNNLVILDVDESYFSDALENIRIYDEKQMILLLDNNGTLISELTAFPDVDYFVTTSSGILQGVQEVINSSENSGATVHFSWSEGMQFIAYTKVPGAGWTIVNIIPYSIILDSIGVLLLLTLLLLVIMLVFGYILSKKLSSMLYAPIKVLYENYVTPDNSGQKGTELELLSKAFSDMYSKADQLEQGLIDSYNESKNMYLRYLLIGDTNKLKNVGPLMKKMNINLSSPYYLTILIDCAPHKLHTQEEKTEKDQKNANLFICYYALENVTREIGSSYTEMEFLRVSDSDFAVLLYLSSPEFPQGLEKDLEIIIQVMEEHFQMDTTICIGDMVDDWQKISLGYSRTYAALKSYSACNYGKVFHAGDNREFLSSSLYFNDLHSSIAENIRSGEVDAAMEAFRKTIQSMQNVRFKDIQTYTRHVMMSVLDEFSSSFERDNEIFMVLMKLVDQMDSCQNLPAMESEMENFISSLSAQLSVLRKVGNQDVARKVQEYVDENYSNPNMSLKMLADMVGLTPAYLGKMFATTTTFSFNDYLNNIRTAKAAELLKTTRMPVGKISEAVGILNTNYFYALFKKRYGTTPAAYRKENKLGDIE